MTEGTDSFGCDMLVKRAPKSSQVQVPVDAAELLAGFGHASGAPAQCHVPGLPVLGSGMLNASSRMPRSNSAARRFPAQPR